MVPFHYRSGTQAPEGVATLGKGKKVILSQEECDALTEHIGQTVTPTTVKSYSRATVNGSLYHSASYKRATKANNYTIVHRDGLGIIRHFIQVANGVVAFIQTLRPTPAGLVSIGNITTRNYLEKRILSVQKGPLKAIREGNILEKCVWCPVGPFGTQYVSRIMLKFLMD